MAVISSARTLVNAGTKSRASIKSGPVRPPNDAEEDGKVDIFHADNMRSKAAGPVSE